MVTADLSPPLHELVFETAAEHVSRRIAVVSPAATVEEVRRSLAGQRFDTVAEIAVCEDGRLKGLVSIEDLLAAPPEAVVAQLMDSDPPTVAPGLDQEKAAWKAVQHGEVSLAVVDEQGRFLGLIPPQRLLRVLLWEHDEDMARLGGFLHATSMARGATEEPVARRLGHRLPWLLLGLAGALLAADVVGLFQGLLENNVVLAFFLPGIVYLADAVGTQTETLVIRGLSVGVPLGRVVCRELLTGLLIGAALGLVFFPFALFRWGNYDVALAVGLALVAACSSASLTAMALPWFLQRLGADPAFGSGPLATVVQDLLSLMIYLAICRAVLG
ncbi:MAG TPA: magnesium transporter [Gemmataceae bacterium]|nr:magnesium transporter [Gemmataceae bacterium]